MWSAGVATRWGHFSRECMGIMICCNYRSRDTCRLSAPRVGTWRFEIVVLNVWWLVWKSSEWKCLSLRNSINKEVVLTCIEDVVSFMVLEHFH